MKEADANLIEKYQKLYARDPSSTAFAPLAEAYRKAGMVKEAIDVCESGIKHNPAFASGHVALGRALLEKDNLEAATQAFKRATELSSDNLLAHELLAETLLRLEKTKEALSAYKSFLFLAPNNQKAQEAVQKLESLTADEYEDELFSMRPLSQAKNDWHLNDIEIAEDYDLEEEDKEDFHAYRILERLLSLSDAFLIRSDFEKATSTLQDAEKQFGPDPEIIRRLKIIHSRQLDALEAEQEIESLEPMPSRIKIAGGEKVDTLETMLKRIAKRRKHI